MLDSLRRCAETRRLLRKFPSAASSVHNVRSRYFSSDKRPELPQSHGHDRLLEGKKVLIANRGEIAMRISRAANALGAKSVAVCAPEDKNSPHVAFADEMVILPKGNTPIGPYLDIDALTRVATDREVDFVHPGEQIGNISQYIKHTYEKSLNTCQNAHSTYS